MAVKDTFQIEAPGRRRNELPVAHRGHGNLSTKSRGASWARQGGCGNSPTPPKGKGSAAIQPAKTQVKLMTHGQKVTVKGLASSALSPHSWGKYGKSYLSRDGVSQEQGRGVGFDGEKAVDLGEMLKGWQQAGDNEYYRVVLSPERSEDLDLTAYTRAVMEKVEGDFGAKLEWGAVAHYYEDGEQKHPHVHVMVRGQTEQGKAIELSNSYLQHQLRGHAEREATDRLGYRLTDYAVERREQTLGQEKYTETDKGLWQRADEERRVRVEEKADDTPADREKTRQEVQRLAYLVGKELAMPVSDNEWKLRKGLPRELNFRAANSEFAPKWRQPEERTEERQREEKQRVVRVVEDERQQGIER